MDITNEEEGMIRQVGTHLTGMDNLFFDLETPRRPMTICSIWQFKQSLDPTLILNALEKLCSQYPKFSLVPKNGNYFETPIWSYPSKNWNFKKNLVFHSLKTPTKKSLQEYIASQYVKPFSYEKPLWQAHFISGFENNQCVFLWKAHHCMSDGIGVMRAVLLSTTSLDPTKQQLIDINHYKKRQLALQHYKKKKILDTLTFKQENNNSNKYHSQKNKKLTKTKAICQSIITKCIPFLFWLLWIWESIIVLKEQVYHEVWTLWIMFFPFLYKRHTLLYKGEQTYDKLIAWTEDIAISDIQYIQKTFGQHYTINDIMLMVFAQTIQRYLQYHQQKRQKRTQKQQNDLTLRIVIPLSYRLPTDWEMKNVVTGNMLQITTTAQDHPSSTSTDHLLHTIHRNMLCVKRSYFPYFTYQIYIQGILRYFPFLKLPSWIQNQYTELPHAIFTNIIGPSEPTYFGGQEMTHLHALAPQNSKGSISVGLVSYCKKINISMLTDDHPDYPDLANVLCRTFVSEFNSLLTEAYMKNKG
ncbi:unnamed protein product [Cunninghamella echinulata]